MGDVVLIIGGAGFIGQHLVYELQERDDTVAEIRILDLQPYKKKLPYRGTIPVESIIGDITCDPIDDDVRRAFESVQVVYFCASVFTIEYPPHNEDMNKVNVKGKWLTYSPSYC